MKLNNKGFAITAVLYGLLILFVILISTYLTILSSRKNRLDSIVKDIEDSYNEKALETVEEGASDEEKYEIVLYFNGEQQSNKIYVNKGDEYNEEFIITDYTGNPDSLGFECEGDNDYNIDVSRQSFTITVSNVTSNTKCDITFD